MVKANFVNEEGTKELIEQFESEYLQVGMEIMTSVSRILILLTIVSALVFLNPDHPFYWRATRIWPISFILFCLIDRYFCRSKLLSKIFIIIVVLYSGLGIVQANLKNDAYSFYEIWPAFIIFCQYFGILMFNDWIKVVISFYVVAIGFLVLLVQKYTNIPVVLYVSFLFVLIYYPLICLFISQKYKEMITLFKTNKDLVHTIQIILKVLPEGVIIRSVDPITQRVITEFANDYAHKFIKENNGDISISEDHILKIVKSSASPPSNSSDNLCSLNDFLNYQEEKIEDHEDYIGEMVEIKELIERLEERKDFTRNNLQNEDQENDVCYYNIKSVKVRWMNKDSFVHMFVDTTQVKKLAEERANRECQQIMFASLSHDMRTPLNAFTNSLQLVQFTLNELSKSFANYPENQKLRNIFKIGEVSSCLLLNLVEDILDMAKFNANTFKLNIESFSLESVLKEIEYIFGFQCSEKRLEFKIICDRDISQGIYNSDSKRLKQVFINLVSNSLKFTERGGITIRVSKFVNHGDTYLKFKVMDTGVGINKKDIPSLFNLFGMLEKHRSKLNKSGSGLGLSISKKIVESLGGKISVTSEEGRWTIFKFTIKISERGIEEQEESKQYHMEEEEKRPSELHMMGESVDQLPDCSEDVQCTYRRDYMIKIGAAKLNSPTMSRKIFEISKLKQN